MTYQILIDFYPGTKMDCSCSFHGSGLCHWVSEVLSFWKAYSLEITYEFLLHKSALIFTNVVHICEFDDWSFNNVGNLMFCSYADYIVVVSKSVSCMWHFKKLLWSICLVFFWELFNCLPGYATTFRIFMRNICWFDFHAIVPLLLPCSF